MSLQSICMKNLTESVFQLSHSMEGVLLKAGPAINIPVLISAVGALYVLQGKAISYITNGKYTNLANAILSNPKIYAFCAITFKVALAVTAIFITLLLLSSITKVITAKILGREVPWDHWKPLLAELGIISKESI